MVTKKSKTKVTQRKPKPKLAPPATIDERQRYTIEEANAILRQCRAQTYKDIRNKVLRVIRAGRRVYAPGSELIRLSTLAD